MCGWPARARPRISCEGCQKVCVYSTAWYRIYILTPYTLVPQRPLHRARPRNSKKYALQSFCIVYRVSYRGIRKFTFGNFYLLAHQVHARNIVCMRIRCMPANIVCVTWCCSVCSVLQCVAAGRSGLYLLAHQLHGRQHVVHAIVLQCVAVCCSVLQCVAVPCSALQSAAVCFTSSRIRRILADTLCVPSCCSMLQCVAVCCRTLQCVAVGRTSSRIKRIPADTLCMPS